MERSDIVGRIDGEIEYFLERWNLFCRQMEEYFDAVTRLAGEAEKKYEAADKKNWPKTAKAIEAALDRLQPALDRVASARAAYNEFEPRARRRTDRIAGAVNRMLNGLAAQGLDAGAQRRRERKIKAKGQALIYKHDEPAKKPFRDLQAVLTEYGEIKQQTTESYHLAVAQAKRQPVADHRWVEHRDFGPWDFIQPIRYFCPFWLPSNIANPAAWFFDKGGQNLSADDQLLYDAVILAVAHDAEFVDKGAGARRIYTPGTYAGPHFQADAFVQALTKWLTDLEIAEAWARIEPLLPAKAPTGQGQSVEHPRHTARRSKPLSKTAMMQGLGIDSRKAFNALATTWDIQQVGRNRQLFTLDMDLMDERSKAKIERV